MNVLESMRQRMSAGVEDVEPREEQLRDLHRLIAKVTSDTEELRFNTAIAAMMEFMNAVKKWGNRPRAALEPFALLLAPYAPHLAEECWAMCGHGETLAYEPWPQLERKYVEESTVTLPVQVNGKVRTTVSVPADIDEDAAVALAREDERVQRHMAGKELKKVIFKAGKILNLIVK